MKEKMMKQIIEKLRNWMSVLMFGEIAHGKPLPSHVRDLKLDPKLLWVHMMSAESPRPPSYKKAHQDDFV